MQTNIMAKSNQIQTWEKKNKIVVQDLDIEEQNRNISRHQNEQKGKNTEEVR